MSFPLSVNTIFSMTGKSTQRAMEYKVSEEKHEIIEEKERKK